MLLCDGNYGVGAHGMDLVHNREPEQSRVTNWYFMKVKSYCFEQTNSITVYFSLCSGYANDCNAQCNVSDRMPL